ncbi:hypothetical protein SLS61_003474 [Didymella pomorum]
MPPANSPNREPTPFTSALRGLESPVNDDVLNLAATLTAGEGDMEASMDEAHASLRYLRREQARDEQRLEESRNRLRQLERTRDDLDHRDRLRRSMDRLNRLHETAAANQYLRARWDQEPGSAPYGEQIPSQNSLNDWAPHSRDYVDEAELERRSLRSTAILQAVRRHPRFSARTREYLQRFTYDRERERERDRDTMREAAREGHPAGPQPARDSTSLRRSTQEPWGGPRERYQASSAQPASQPPPVAPMLEHTVKYLSRIRHASTVDESLNCALEAGFLSKDYFCIQYADFLTDTLSIPPPHETSWLAPGAVLSGCQHATTSMSTPNPNSASQLPPPSRPWLSASYSTPRSLTSYLPTSRTDPTPLPPQQDRWPVKVTVHAVDWSAMSLSATMEAYNVPSHPHQHSLNNPGNNSHNSQYTRTSSITTYLEGEILDFNTHTLLTESFTSSAATDAVYWRKLPPFRDLGDEDVVRALTSRRWWEALSREWVLMRWKERCFVKSLRPGSNSKTSSLEPTPAPTSASRPDLEDTNIHADLTGEEYYTYDSHTFAQHAAPQPASRPRRDPARYAFPYEPARSSPPPGEPSHTIPPPVYEQTPPSHTVWPDGEHAAFDDSGCGLTISGFYYVCLRREDGRVEGLYYDPMSSPYQCLVLESRPRMGFARWEFA